MMKTILDIVDREPNPAPWSEDDNISWNDPGFSEWMLAEHVSQEHDLASRKSAAIDEHVDWICSTVLDGRPARVLDLVRGPGLYAHRLSVREAIVTRLRCVVRGRSARFDQPPFASLVRELAG